MSHYDHEIRDKARVRLEGLRREAIDMLSMLEFILANPCPSNVATFRDKLSYTSERIYELQQKPRILRRLPRGKQKERADG